MERDFMGLNSVVVVKEEEDDGACKHSGFARSSGIPWPLSTKVSSHPHFMSLKSEKEEKTSKNFGGNTMKQQFPGGNPHSILPSTEQWINSKASGFPAQLTIFYDGTVNVFDGISPEKAQAMMFLAGNGCIISNMAQPKTDNVQAPASKHVAADVPLSPMSVSSHPIHDHSSNNKDIIKVSMAIGTSPNKLEPQRMVSSFAATAAIISSAIPQARKASLARFLEKRKERAMQATPYNLGKKAADCVKPGSNDFGFSATSGVGSDN